MTLTRPATQRWQRVLTSLLATAGLLAACGGGTSQYEPFVAERFFAFGDDNSAFTAQPAGNASKYSVNGLDDAGNVDCRVLPIWVQSVASVYGFVFAECNPDNLPEPKARSFAAAGARVADVAAQVEAAQAATGGLRDKDLTTVLAGTNDIIDLYRLRYPVDGSAGVPSEDELLAEARERGKRLAQAVNRLVELGAKVIISGLPNVGLTPFALKEKALHTDTDRAALLERLTNAFNEQLGVNILLDGRYVGLVQADLQFRAIADSPGSYGFSNVTVGACTVELPACTTATLLPGANASQFLWADDTRFSSGAHAQMAALAVDRAQNNPF